MTTAVFGGKLMHLHFEILKKEANMRFFSSITGLVSPSLCIEERREN